MSAQKPDLWTPIGLQSVTRKERLEEIKRRCQKHQPLDWGWFIPEWNWLLSEIEYLDSENKRLQSEIDNLRFFVGAHYEKTECVER